MKDKREMVEIVDRNKALTKLDKWNDFRKKREKVMDDYVKVLKRSKALTLLMKYRKLACVLSMLKQSMDHTRELHEREIKMAFICINIRFGWRRLLRRWGLDHQRPIAKPDVELIHERRLRHALTATAQFVQDQHE